MKVDKEKEPFLVLVLVLFFFLKEPTLSFRGVALFVFRLRVSSSCLVLPCPRLRHAGQGDFAWPFILGAAIFCWLPPPCMLCNIFPISPAHFRPPAPLFPPPVYFPPPFVPESRPYSPPLLSYLTLGFSWFLPIKRSFRRFEVLKSFRERGLTFGDV